MAAVRGRLRPAGANRLVVPINQRPGPLVASPRAEDDLPVGQSSVIVRQMPAIRNQLAVRESFVPSGGAPLYVRDVGRGQPVVVVHGGPDFDHEYLLPDLDRLAELFHLVY